MGCRLAQPVRFHHLPGCKAPESECIDAEHHNEPQHQQRGGKDHVEGEVHLHDELGYPADDAAEAVGPVDADGDEGQRRHDEERVQHTRAHVGEDDNENHEQDKGQTEPGRRVKLDHLVGEGDGDVVELNRHRTQVAVDPDHPPIEHVGVGDDAHLPGRRTPAFARCRCRHRRSRDVRRLNAARR